MPSFQTRLKITGLKPGTAPEAVMAAAIWFAHRHERRAVKQPIQKTPTPAART